MTMTMERSAVLACLGDWSRGPGALYARLAGALQRAIGRGDIPPSTRLPAERSLAAALILSRGTVMAAYAELRLAGLVESRQGSGTWVRCDVTRPLEPGEADPGPIARVRGLANRVIEQQDSTIDLAVAATTDLDHLAEDYLRPPDRLLLERLSGGHGYQPAGLPRLRERVRAYYQERGLPTAVGNVLVTGGAQQAISLLTELVVKRGDAVVVEAPTYPGALDVFFRAGARIIRVPEQTSWTRSGALREAVRQNAPRIVYLMPACHNPVGRSMEEIRRREVARLADEHEVYVLEDNSLADVLFTGEHVPPVASFSRSGRVLTLGSVSKVAWGGLRAGWLRGPAGLIDRLARLRAARDFGDSPLPQLVTCNVLDHLSKIARLQTASLRARYDVLRGELSRRLPGWAWTEPDGGLSLWIRLPWGDADELAQLALRHGVAFTPGSAHTGDGSHRDHLRLVYARRPEVLREGVTRLATAWGEYAATLARRQAV